jgi:type I restriction enzyme S subunit
VETAIDAAQREIDLIREYRTRLVADVVTGRLDVRPRASASEASASPSAALPSS